MGSSCRAAAALAWGATAFASSWATVATAEPKATLSVQRGVGAETCADSTELRSLIEAIAGAGTIADQKAPLHLDVRIIKTRKAFVATIDLTGKRKGTRTIEEAGPGCEVLAQALAVSISVLLDEVEPVVPEPPPDPQAPPPPVFKDEWKLEPFVDPSEKPEEPTGYRPPLTLSAAGFYDFGTVTSASAGGLVLAADLYIPIVSFGVAFVGIPHVERGTGSSRVSQFLGARARVCTREPYFEMFGASVCFGVIAGERKPPRVAYVSLPIQLEVSRRVVGPFGVFADLSVTPAITRYRRSDEPVTFQMGAGVRFWMSE